MNQNLRIGLIGPKGIGKTTAITTLCESPAFDSDAANLSTNVNDSSITTVRVDFGELEVGAGDWLQIYGCSTHAELKFVRQWVLSMVAGAFLMIDLSRSDAHDQAIELLNEVCAASPAIIAAVLVARPATPAQLDAFGAELAHSGLGLVPVIQVDVRDLKQISDAFLRIVSMVSSKSAQ